MTPLKPRKLTAMERRAAEMCADLKRYGSSTIVVEWKRSRMYGLCPSISYNGAKVVHASGCGYCKHSAVLAEALRFLGETSEEVREIWQTSGAGESSVVEALDRIGWTMTRTASIRLADVWQISKKEG